ncbi:MAG: ABC transporter permease [Bacteroidales bacterium]|nr:ABC transporter permease [Bacteroidales bacterium]
MRNFFLIVRREYRERVRTKSFIVTTLLTPVLMIIMMVLPSVLMLMGGQDKRSIAVIDETAMIGPRLQSSPEIQYAFVDISLDSAKNDERFDGVLVIGPDIMTNTSDLTLYTHESTGMEASIAIPSQVSKIIEQERLKKYDISNLDKIMDEVKADCVMKTLRISDEGDTEDSTIVSFAIGFGMGFILYMFIILYGQMVMTSIIEEKNNRVLEVVVSSVKPTTLMCGKVVGIGCVAATQIVIWGLIVSLFMVVAMPFIGAETAAAASNADLEELMPIIGQLNDPGYIISMFAWLTAFLIGGYMFYCGIFAAIGSAVDNAQDASQLTTIAMVPIIIAFIVDFSVMNNPNSTMALVMSLIPFTSPIVMASRIPFGIPLWQPVVSLLILAVSVVFILWFAAKVYRVGIFMYGKKPTLRDLIRWARYK